LSNRMLRKIVQPVRSTLRKLNLQEFSSKELMEKHGLAVQRFKVAETDQEGVDGAQYLLDTGASELVIKAQILAGGRGKGTFDSGFKGGVHLTKDPKEVGALVKAMVGNRLSTKQTPPEGVEVKKVMVAHALDIERETYLAVLMDRAFNGPVLVGSPDGGMDIEEVAEKTPERIFTMPIDINDGISRDQSIEMAKNLNFEGDKIITAAEQIEKLYNLFIAVDATQVEINPFGETTEGEVVCFDAKINFDDNAAYRQKEIFAMGDTAESDPREVDAEQFGLNYIGLDGQIGCLVNGAGLAMATMDIVKLEGGEPANFLDLGGGVQEQGVYEAFRIITSDPRVKTILVNIFGGIVNCEVIARGINRAYAELGITVPVVCRLEGTNVDSAKQILAASGNPVEAADSMQDAAKKAVALTPSN
jgi:succinyl-CoA synthetase beta subunit